MIAIVSSIPRERSAFALLCEAQSWAHTEADSVSALKKICRRLQPRVALIRHKLLDGYSDDIIASLCGAGKSSYTKILVLLAANASASVEARQLVLGADCVQRDPARAEVVSAYLAKYYTSNRPKSHLSPPAVFRFGAGGIDPISRTLSYANRVVRLTPREVELCQLLAESGGLVTYETLYAEILGRKFHGDTSNLRVLLGKLENSVRATGMEIRQWISVVPKLGYRYVVT